MYNNDEDYKDISREQLAIIVIFSFIISSILGLGIFGFSWIVLPFVITVSSVAVASICYIVMLVKDLFK